MWAGKGGAAWENRSRVTKHNLSQAQILLSTRYPSSLAYGIAPLFDSPRKCRRALTQAAHYKSPLLGGTFIMCGLGESNSRLILGKDMLYHLTKTAYFHSLLASLIHKLSFFFKMVLPIIVLPTPKCNVCFVLRLST